MKSMEAGGLSCVFMSLTLCGDGLPMLSQDEMNIWFLESRK